MPLATITNGAPFSTKCRDSSVFRRMFPGRTGRDLLRQPLKVKQVGAAHQTLDPAESRVLGGSRRLGSRSLAADETPRCLALFVVDAGDVRQPFDVRQLVLAAQPNRAVLGSQPGPVAALKPLNSFPSGQGSSRMKFGMGLSVPQLLANHRAQRGADGGRGLSPGSADRWRYCGSRGRSSSAHHRELVRSWHNSASTH